MGVEIKWLGHSCFRMADGSLAVYTDPYNLAAAVNDGDVICISHAHYDHCSPDDIARIAKPDATIVCTEDVVSQVGNFLKNIVVISPGRTVNVGSLKIEGVAAYNIGKKFHPQDSGWCGYVLNIGGRRIYYAGDS
ncbi:MAG TPA: MBL fold metallo-hydrolase, partial [Phycisphaerae bacterium]|nr:MBL fold metallo-hydrolase [Phycisphaerae bacterium]